MESVDSDLQAFLKERQLTSLEAYFIGWTLDALTSTLSKDGRVAFLSLLQALGLKLADRQRLVNELKRAVRRCAVA